MKGQEGRRYYLTAALVVFGTAAWQMRQITGPVMLPDEFGYWANAAQMLGYDWSGVVSLQSYYSFGYSFLLVPFLKYIKNPFVMYRAAVLMNVFFVYLQAVLLWKIAGRIKPGKEHGRRNFFFCLAASCYPSVLFYMQMTWTESLLGVLFLGSVWLLARYEEEGKLRHAAGFSLCLAYLYFVHMRTLGVLAAGAAALLWTAWRKAEGRGSVPGPSGAVPEASEGRKRCEASSGAVPETADGNGTGSGGRRETRGRAAWGGLLARAAVPALILAVCLCAGGLMKEWLQEGLYGNTAESLLETNDYGGQFGKLAALLSPAGAYAFAVSCLGKVFYLGLSTCGTVYFGAWHVLKRAKRDPVCGYLGLAGLFTFGITALYTMNGVRADSYVYGRYHEFLVPVFVYLGLAELWECRYLKRAVLGITALQAGMLCVLLREMSGARPGGYQGYFTVGISYAVREYMPEISGYLTGPFAAGTAAMFLLMLVMGYLAKRKKEFIGYLWLLAALYVYTAASAGGKYLYDHSIDAGEDLALAVWAGERMEEGEEAVFVNSYSEMQYVDNLQLGLGERSLTVAEEEEFVIPREEKPEYVFTYRTCGKEEMLEEAYGMVKETYHFRVYYDGDAGESGRRGAEEGDG